MELFKFIGSIIILILFIVFVHYLVQKKKSYVPVLIFILLLVSPLFSTGLPFRKYFRLNEIFLIVTMLIYFAAHVVKKKQIGLRKIEALLLFMGCSLTFSIFYGYLFLDIIPSLLDFNQILNIFLFMLYFRVGSFINYDLLNTALVRKTLFILILFFNIITFSFLIPEGLKTLAPLYLPEIEMARYLPMIKAGLSPVRIPGIVGSANTSAMLSVVIIIPMISWLMFIPPKNTTNRILTSVLLVFSLANLVLMFSRNALIALILGVVFLFITSRSIYKINRLRLILFTLMLFLLASFALPYALSFWGISNESLRGLHFEGIFGDKDAAFSRRSWSWQMGIEKGMLSPIFGWGPGMASNMLANELNMTDTIKGFYAPHNEYLEILLSSGMVGLALYLFYFISIYKKAINLVNNKSDNISVFLGRSVQAIIVAIAFFNLSDGWWHNAIVPPLLMLLFGAMYAVDNKKVLFKNANYLEEVKGEKYNVSK